MSYTKLNNEIEKYYRQNSMIFTYNALTTTKEEQEEHLKTYNQIKDIIIKKWIVEKRYKELISCAHGGWFSEEVFLIPLAKHFVKEKELIFLKFLYERQVKFLVESTLRTIEYAKEDYPNILLDDIITFDLEKYKTDKQHNSIGEAGKWREKTMKKLDQYIDFLKETDDYQYLELIEGIRKKIFLLSVKKSDLKNLNTKLEKKNAT